jgi:hypothetical protein
MVSLTEKPCRFTLAGLFWDFHWFGGPLIVDSDTVPVGAGLPAMVVNDYARELDKRGALESIAGKPAPTVSRECVKNLL